MNSTIDAEIKRDIANCFLSDAFEFLERAGTLRGSSKGRPTFRAKILADLCLSIECSLKAALSCHTAEDETPKDLYKKIRKKCHNLGALLAHVRSLYKQSFELSNQENEMLAFSISYAAQYRYSLDYGGVLHLLSKSVLLEDLPEALFGRISSHIKLADRIYQMSRAVYVARYPSVIALGGGDARKYKDALLCFYKEIYQRPNKTPETTR